SLPLRRPDAPGRPARVRARAGHGARPAGRRHRDDAAVIGARRPPDEAQLLARAEARLGRTGLYPRPVSLRYGRILIVPWFFRLPFLRRFHGYALPRTILVKQPPSDNLVTHELTHVWQMQHHPLRMPLSYLYTGYRANPYEREARWVVSNT